MAHRVNILTTGGTIEGEVAEAKQQPKDMIVTAAQFTSLLGRTIDVLCKEYNIDGVDIHHDEVERLDSSNIEPCHWVKLAEKIRDDFDTYDSFIITHGTNTLGYTAAALSFALVNPGKPIILTGSQVPYGVPGSDAQTNLENALRLAVWPREKNPIRGVLAIFGSHIITGTRVKKDTEFDYDAFKSFGTGAIGRIGRIIDIDDANLEKHLQRLRASGYPVARDKKTLRCEARFEPQIASLTEFPGMDTKIFQTLVEDLKVKGFILRAFGAGDPCRRHLESFRWLKGKEIPLVVTTQAPNGNASLLVNQPGVDVRTEELAIPAWDMSIESQTTKLMWLLARPKFTYGQICEAMTTDMRGEINVKWELGV